MYTTVIATIDKLSTSNISETRKKVLLPLVNYIQHNKDANLPINLNFICTHNSRRSHLSQIWAQVAAAYCKVQQLYCYSGGTEATAVFPKIMETLTKQGFQIHSIANTTNPIYAVKFDADAAPIIAFSKKYDDAYNPTKAFAAILTCSDADENCPLIIGAEKRIPITYEDPKKADNTNEQDMVYNSRSLEIATEMFYVFTQIKK